MDPTAYFKFTYGLFVAGVEYEGKKNGCIINTATQATSEPGRVLATMMKSNLTTELILKKGSLTISVLALDCPLDRIGHFGMNKGRDKDKFADVPFERDARGNPYILDYAVARFHCKVEQAIDLDTHYLFVCAVEDCVSLSDKTPITYGDYRVLKSGGTLAKTVEEKKAEAAPAASKWVCSVCHYVYSGDSPFENLPPDWKCPVCSQGKGSFVKEG